MKWGRGPSVLAPALLALTAPPALAADQLVKGTRLIPEGEHRAGETQLPIARALHPADPGER